MIVAFSVLSVEVDNHRYLLSENDRNPLAVRILSLVWNFLHFHAKLAVQLQAVSLKVLADRNLISVDSLGVW